MASNAEVVRAFIAAWSRLDVDELLGYFAPDGIYYNMPIAPISGHQRCARSSPGSLPAGPTPAGKCCTW